MLIIKDNANDITNNLSIICPNSSFSNYLYKKKNRTIIIYYKNDYYEPLITFTENSNKKVIQKFFKLNQQDTPIYNILVKLNNNILSRCNYNYKNEKYDFKENIDIYGLLTLHQKELTENNIEIIQQIINYDNKVIGIYAKYNNYKENIFIPLKPSAIHPDYDYDLIHDELWNSYVNTKKILREIHQIIPRIECNPIYKIVEDNMIVGIITGSNQFVKLNEIVPDTREDDIELLPGFDETKIDKMLINHDENRDIIRNKVIHFLNLENHFYIAYINSIKVFIHDKKNIKLKKDIENIITRLNTEEMEILYNELYSIIEKITLNNFEFNSFKDDELINLHEIELCNNKDEKKIYCLFENDKNKLILPIKNLYNGESNLVKYVSDLTHDLLFNNTFQSKVLKNLQTIVNENIPLRINENEILLIESMIKKYYSSIKRKSSKYISNKVFEEMVPSDILKLVEHKLLNMEDEPEEDVEEETEEEKEEEVKKLTPIIEEENVEKIPGPEPQEEQEQENKVKTPSPEPQEEEQENKVKTPSPEPQEEEQENKAKTPSPEPQEEEQENVVKIPSPEPQEEQEQENKSKNT